MKKTSIHIRQAKKTDTAALFKLGQHTPEFQTSNQEPFMEQDELQWRVGSPTSTFLMAESGKKLAGFIYAETVNTDAPIRSKFSCVVYIVVAPDFRKQGIATKLLEACEQELKEQGMEFVYVWANQGGDKAIEKFLKKEGYIAGHTYRWMDKKL